MGEASIRVMIVDDHDMVRLGLEVSLSGLDGYELVGVASRGEEAIKLCAECHPDVVLMDLVMPGMNGVQTIRAIRAQYPTIQMIALTSFKEEDLVHGALQAGAVGYLTKSVSIEEMTFAIRNAYERKSIWLSRVTQELAKVVDVPTLNTVEDFLPALSSRDQATRGKAVIELSELRRQNQTILRESPAQEAFWRNVYHNYHNLVNFSPDQALEKMGELAEVALALTESRSAQNIALKKLTVQPQSTDIQVVILKALGLNQDKKAAPILLEATQHDDSKIRAAAIEALGLIQSKTSISTLEKALDDGSISVRFAAVNALTLIGSSKALAVLHNLLKTGDLPVKIDVVQALARPESRIDKITTGKILLQLIKEKQDDNLLYTTAIALSQLGYAPAIPVLEKLLDHESEHVREGAQKALDSLRSKL